MSTLVSSVCVLWYYYMGSSCSKLPLDYWSIHTDMTHDEQDLDRYAYMLDFAVSDIRLTALQHRWNSTSWIGKRDVHDQGTFHDLLENHEHVKLFSTHQLLCVAVLLYNRCHWRKVVWSSIASHYKDMILLCMLGACTWILNTSWISLKSTVSSSCSIFTWLESQEAGEIRFVKHVR